LPVSFHFFQKKEKRDKVLFKKTENLHLRGASFLYMMIKKEYIKILSASVVGVLVYYFLETIYLKLSLIEFFRTLEANTGNLSIFVFLGFIALFSGLIAGFISKKRGWLAGLFVPVLYLGFNLIKVVFTSGPTCSMESGLGLVFVLIDFPVATFGGYLGQKIRK